MGFDLKDLKKTGEMKAPRILIYGPPGTGKTSLAASFPNPVILDVEDGIPAGVEIATLGEINSFQDVIDRLAALVKQDHDFKTLITDSLDRMEPLIWQHYCEENNYESIESPGFGKGYTEVLDLWERYLKACQILRRDKGMTIIHVAHSTVAKFDDPKVGPYSRYNSRLHTKANNLVQDDVDAILFVNQDVALTKEDEGFGRESKRAEGGHITWIYAAGKPGYVAKNRYGIPDELVYEEGEGFITLEPYLPIEVEVEAEAETEKKGA